MHGPSVYRFTLRHTGNRGIAEDLAQETYVRAWRARSSYRGEASERAWLLAIAGNVVRDHARMRMRRAVESTHETPEVAAPGSDPAEHVEQAYALQRLQAALRALPEHHREMFLLRERDGLTYKEIAAVLAVPIGSVMSGLSRARERLIDAVEG